MHRHGRHEAPCGTMRRLNKVMRAAYTRSPGDDFRSGPADRSACHPWLHIAEHGSQSAIVAWTLGAGWNRLQRRQTPTGWLLQRSAQTSDRPAVFAAQFALSHACWLLTYPLAGWLGKTAGLSFTALVLAVVRLFGVTGRCSCGPRKTSTSSNITTRRCPLNDPHLADASEKRHAHPFVIDDRHKRWPYGALTPTTAAD
jgi:hypothetical protein